MIGLDIKVEGAEEIKKRLANFDAILGKQVRRGIYVLSEIGKMSARSSLHPGGKGYATGDMQRNIFSRITSDFGGEVTSEAPYSAFVEFPTRPHWPPISKIVEWVHIKFGLKGKEAQSVGFLVARAIARRGTQGLYFMEKAFRATEKQVPEVFERMMKAVLMEITK